MGKDGLCPCCGRTMETHRHLYQCTNQSMSNAFGTAIKEAKKKLVKDKIPAQIYLAFLNSICKAVGKPPVDWFKVMENRALSAVSQQEYLGRDAIIKGFHVWEWAYALEDLWTPPRINEHGKKKTRRTPLKCRSHFCK